MKPKTIKLKYIFPSQACIEMEFEELHQLREYLSTVIPLYNSYHANLSRDQEPISEIRIKFDYFGSRS